MVGGELVVEAAPKAIATVDSGDSKSPGRERRAGSEGVRAQWRDGARARVCARAVAAPKNWNPCHWQLPRASQGPVASACALPAADGPALGAHHACFFGI